MKMVSYRKYVLTAVLALSLAAVSCSPLTMVGLGARGAETPLEVAKVTPTATPVPTPTPLRPLDRLGATQAQDTALPATELKVEATEEELLVNLYERVNPAVVNIRVIKRVEQPATFAVPDEFYQEGQGSGFVWDQKGHIVTNNHVVEGTDEVEVVFWDDTVVAGKVIGTDPDSDLAVVEVDQPAAELHPVELGDSEELKVGQMAIAIGNPFGQAGTMTRGIISALGRTFTPESSPFSIAEMIQTDAAINPGNSGGPLLDSQGRVIGINSLILSRSGSSSGVGFAVPVNMAKRVVPVLIEEGEYHYAWLGITGTDLTPAIVEAMDLPAGTRGALVIEVGPDGPADKAALRGSTETVESKGRPLEIGGDIIMAIDGTPVQDMDDVIVYLVQNTRPEQKVELSILRDGQEQKLTVELGERPGNVIR
ncbi:MAG: trypsin-like peptidase domain-containing protein [Anaerolineae bacterium]|nr:trypsin-like peptidase domain-containing protein [Anaerolineae bacterium]